MVVRRYIDFLILLIPIFSSCTYLLFFAASLLFAHLKKKFFVLVPVLFVIYVIIFSCSINTHTDNCGRPTAAI